MSKGNQDVLTKGPRMEELLRSYFLKTGYYVVRGVPFIYEGFDVTDIDLWLYSRTSSVSREVALVDAKNKKTRKRLNAFSGCRGCGSPQRRPMRLWPQRKSARRSRTLAESLAFWFLMAPSSESSPSRKIQIQRDFLMKSSLLELMTTL